ncbi:MAG: hypothetical protein JXR95_07940 [Deltaproteobacteria bacterium]|nr:hypothetical protein [Deltaproteobacteria bacterium]
MQNILDSHGYSHTAKALRFLNLRLNRVPELASFIPVVSDMRDHLNTDYQNWKNTVESRVALTSEIAWLDKEIDNTVITMGQTAYLKYNRDRTNPNYKGLFPLAPSKMVNEVAGPSKNNWVNMILDTVRKNEEYNYLNDYAGILKENMQRLTATLNQRQELYTQEASTWTKYTITFDSVRSAYNSLYHQFMLILPGKKSLIESLFITKTASKMTSDDPVPSNDE